LNRKVVDNFSTKNLPCSCPFRFSRWTSARHGSTLQRQQSIFKRFSHLPNFWNYTMKCWKQP